MNMFAFTLAFAALWVVQMLLSWRQAKRFMADIAVLRGSGVVFIGRGKRRTMRTYAALAIHDGVVTESRILNGYTVFARGKPQPALVGTHVDDLIAGTVAGLDRRTAAAAAQAATLYTQQRSRKRKVALR
jgi:DNA-binding transcriptional regulator of glucitol operon